MSSPYSTPNEQGPGESAFFIAANARQLQIVTVAMAMAVLVMTGVFLGINQGELKTEPEFLSWIGVGMAVMMTFNSLVVPRIVATTTLKKIDSNQLRDATLEEQFALVSPAFRSRHIIGCAILEGAAVLNLVFYMITSYVGNVAAASVLLIFILMRFPTASRIEFWTQDKIRELDMS